MSFLNRSPSLESALSKVVLPLSIGEVRVRFGLVASDPALAPASGVTPLADGIDTAIPPEPKEPSEKAGSTEKAREAAALELAEWMKDRAMTGRALDAFASFKNPLYAKADRDEQHRLNMTISNLNQQLRRTERGFEDRAQDMAEADRKQKMDNFIASYKAANSELH